MSTGASVFDEMFDEAHIDSRKVDLPDQAVELPGRYSIDIHRGVLTVYGCDCCETIDTVDKAREVMALIQAWIDAPER